MPRSTAKNGTAAGYAALSICEFLLLALEEQNILTNGDVRGILEDAAATHRAAVDTAADVAVHLAAAKLIEKILGIRVVMRPL